MSTKKLFGTVLIFFGMLALLAGVKQIEGVDTKGNPLFRLLQKIQAGTLTEAELKSLIADLKIPDLYVLRKALEEHEQYEFAIIVRDELSKKHQV